MDRITLPLFPRWFRLAGVVAVAAVIFYLSVVTVPPEQAVAPKPDLVPLDKWRHFLAYAAFGASVAYVLVESRRGLYLKMGAVFLVALTYGVGIEAWQAFLPRRYFGIEDAVANGIGAGLSLLWYAIEPRTRFVPLARLRGR
ncbi:MAG: VanZ family protein [Halobacteriales archaeon]